ncbi:MAG: hypothetical protein E7075_00175 [Bacteroidales bacterium]|nr:hypothetical protein [Bacteroidales bacterium]
MAAYTFRRTDSWRGNVSNPKGSMSTRRTLNFCGKYIRLTKLMADHIGVTAGSHLAFTIDEDKPECIYVRQADGPDDTKEIQFPLLYDHKEHGTLRCCSSVIVRHVLHFANAQKSCTCYVASNPINIDGKQHYQILLANPYRVK